jgi:cytochrome P450 family 619
LFLAIAKLLWAFDFKAGKDENGEELVPDTNPTTGYSEGFLVCAKPYALDVKVRGERRSETILKEYDAAKRDYFAAFDVEA